MNLQAENQGFIYLINLDQLESQIYSYAHKILPASELDYLHAIKSKSRKLEYMGGRVFLRLALSFHYSTSAHDIAIEKNDKGKPFTSSIEPHVYFNLSHSHEQLAIIVSQVSEVGIDIECLNPQRKRNYSEMVKRYFHHEEFAALKHLNGGMLQDMFYKIWTSKEAIAKTLSVDLFAVLKAIDLSAIIDNHQKRMTMTYMNKDVHLVALDEFEQKGDEKYSKRYIAYCAEKVIENLNIYQHDETIKKLIDGA